MIAMPLSDAAQALDAQQLGDDVEFRGVSTDTRTLSAGNLFVALEGPNFDGHSYLDQARARGAAAALVSRAAEGGLPQLAVEDTRLALGRLAAHWRARFSLPLVAVTGSNGKTTVKEMLAAILQTRGETLVTQGNFNNDIGVPHTLFGLSDEHRYAVVECGANHPGEIACLVGLVRPTVALVNNAGPAHLEGFGSLAGVAEAKGEMFAGAPADACCVINADDVFADRWRELAGQRPTRSFGLDADADVTADWQGDAGGSDLQLRTANAEAESRILLPGRHNVMNALAATAAALSMGIELTDIANGLQAVRAVHGRWELQPGISACQVIDDTYNANPASLKAGLDILAGGPGESWLVLGDMGELGSDAAGLHRDMGEAARSAGVSRLFAFGELAAEAAATFGQGAECFDDVDALKSSLRQQVHEGITVLVKGSRSMRMERIVAALGAGSSPEGAH